MKKIILSVVVLGTIGFTSCKSDDGVDLIQQRIANEAACDAAFDAEYVAANAYYLNVTTETCDAYKAALNALINSTVCGLDADDKAYYQNLLDTVTANCAGSSSND